VAEQNLDFIAVLAVQENSCALFGHDQAVKAGSSKSAAAMVNSISAKGRTTRDR
jgi:hypothetical protein